jgi:glycosyltransferase involved in cell wall biosynthesis
MNSNKIKILFITDAFFVMAGAEKNIYTLATNLKNKGFKSIVCCLKGGKIKLFLEKEGIDILDLSVKKLYNFHGIKQIFKLIRYIKIEDMGLVLTYHESSDYIGFLIKVFTRIPVISCRRDMGYKLKTRHIWAYKFINIFFDRIITVSHAVKAVIVERENVSPNKLLPIYNGLDLSLYTNNTSNGDLKNSLKIDSANAIVAMIGGSRKIKDHKTFFLAASIILKKFTNVKFLLVGHNNQEKGYSFKDIKKVSEELGISKNIIFAGARSDISDILSIIDISVLSSLSEGFSNTIVESMAAGKPVIATRVGGNPEAIIDGKTGILVPPQNPQALADAIMKLLNNEDLAKKMGKEGRKRAASLFSLDMMIDQYEALFKSILKISERSF